MSGKEEFFQYMGATAGTIVLAFLAQAGLRSCIDVGYHETKAEAGASEALTVTRAEESRALEAADIEGAMRKVAANRTGHSAIKPSASSDLSAMSGWVLAPDSAPYEPEIVPAPAGN